LILLNFSPTHLAEQTFFTIPKSSLTLIIVTRSALATGFRTKTFLSDDFDLPKFFLE